MIMSKTPIDVTRVYDLFKIAHREKSFMMSKVRFLETRGREARAMAIKRRRPFNPKSFLAKVGEGRSLHAYSREQIVFSQGDPADAVFYIQRGKVKVTVVSKLGKEAVVAILGTNEFFGEGCLAGQAQRIATAATMTDSVIVRLEKAAILRVIHQEPAFAELFIAHLLGRTIRAEADLVNYEPGKPISVTLQTKSELQRQVLNFLNLPEDAV